MLFLYSKSPTLKLLLFPCEGFIVRSAELDLSLGGIQSDGAFWVDSSHSRTPWAPRMGGNGFEVFAGGLLETSATDDAAGSACEWVGKGGRLENV
jgi:hypothetical protein